MLSWLKQSQAACVYQSKEKVFKSVGIVKTENSRDLAYATCSFHQILFALQFVLQQLKTDNFWILNLAIDVMVKILSLGKVGGVYLCASLFR